MKCSAFWNHTNIRPGNRIYPCCRFKYQIDTFNGNLSNVLHSEKYQNLREKSMSGEFIPGCEKCFYEEQLGHKSLRQEFNEEYSFDEVKLRFLEIGFDNICNLMCDGCNSEFSTRWIAKEKKLYGFSKNGLMEVRSITNIPNDIEKVLFLGGEPLLTNKHTEFLKSLDPNKNPEIIYNTNATIIPDFATKETIDSFKKVHFIISIDGYREVNDQTRQGSSWNQIEFFIQWCQKNNYTFEFNTVLHKNNLLGLGDLADYLNSFDNDWYVNILTHPQQLDIRNCNDEEIRKFIRILQEKTIPNKKFIWEHIRSKVN